MGIDPTVVAWVNQEVASLADRGLAVGGSRDGDLLRYWSLHRPNMLAQLKAAGLAEKLALILDVKRYDALKGYLWEGMAPADAREQANREWLLMVPEAEGEESQPLSALIARLMVPKDS